MYLSRFSVVSIAILALSACASTEALRPFDVAGRAWPDPPQDPRIVFVGEFSDLDDLGIRRSFWERVVDATVGGAETRMVRPMSVAATTDGQMIFVADPDAECVHCYDLANRRYRCLRADDKQGIQAVGLAVIDDQWVVAADPRRQWLYRAGLTDKVLQPFLVSDSLQQPTGLFWNPRTQRLFVTDTAQQSIIEFDKKGNLKRKIGRRGSGEAEFNYPTYVWADTENDLLVTDSLNFRVQRFDEDAEFVFAFGENGDRPGDFARPKGLATDRVGHVYVVDALMHAIQVFNKEGKLLIAVGEQGQGEGEFWLPNGIFVTSDNLIFVADSFNRRVQVFRYVGPEA